MFFSSIFGEKGRVTGKTGETSNKKNILLTGKRPFTPPCWRGKGAQYEWHFVSGKPRRACPVLTGCLPAGRQGRGASLFFHCSLTRRLMSILDLFFPRCSLSSLSWKSSKEKNGLSPFHLQFLLRPFPMWHSTFAQCKPSERDSRYLSKRLWKEIMMQDKNGLTSFLWSGLKRSDISWESFKGYYFPPPIDFSLFPEMAWKVLQGMTSIWLFL